MRSIVAGVGIPPSRRLGTRRLLPMIWRPKVLGEVPVSSKWASTSRSRRVAGVIAGRGFIARDGGLLRKWCIIHSLVLACHGRFQVTDLVPGGDNLPVRQAGGF